MILYLNNYRGFSKTFFDFGKLNFFIGENSTGKTSVLKLLRIFSEFNFRYSFELESSEVDLGNYRELISPEQFETGFEICIFNEKDKKTKAVYLKYKNFEGFAKLSKYAIITEKFQLVMEYDLSNAIYSYWYDNNISVKNNNVNSKSWFEKWINSLELKTDLEENIAKSRGLMSSDFFFTIQQIKRKNSKAHIIDSIDLTLINFDFFGDEYQYIGPIRAEPKRIYESNRVVSKIDGSQAPNQLKNLLGNKKRDETLLKALKKFGRDSGLFDSIEIHNYNDDENTPFELRILINGKSYPISNVGYGISQIMPLLVSVFSTNDVTLLIQQPEVHLHPKAQAAFGTLLYTAYKNRMGNIIVETHSDYIIDRFRIELNKRFNREKKKHNIEENVQLYFFSRSKKGNQISKIRIENDGVYFKNDAEKFKSFFIKEQLELLKI